jgi:hypothetical protein
MKKPLLIAHRGLFEGPSKQLENNPEQIDRALSLGFDCEVDLWYHNKKLWLGHDEPQYEIDSSFLRTRSLWIHAKNLEALEWCTNYPGLEYFWHQEDDFVLTSNNYIWTYPNKPLTLNSVAVMPEWADPEFINLNTECFGICSDFVIKIKTLLDNKKAL